MQLKRRKKRVPKRSFTKSRNIGWYVSYRDAATHSPRKHRFGMLPREETEVVYHQWVVDHLKGKAHSTLKKKLAGRRKVDFRVALGDIGKSLSGFYSLRHLGATEFGSRPVCSISEMKRWLGHGASSQMADVYMKPVSPEIREVIKFVRETLATGKLAEGNGTCER